MNLQFLLGIHVAIDLWTKKGNLKPISQQMLVFQKLNPHKFL